MNTRSTHFATYLASIGALAAVGMIVSSGASAKTFNPLCQIDTRGDRSITGGIVNLHAMKTQPAISSLPKDDVTDFFGFDPDIMSALEDDGMIAILLKEVADTDSGALSPEDVKDIVIVATGAKAIELGHLTDTGIGQDAYVVYGFGNVALHVVAAVHGLNLPKIALDFFDADDNVDALPKIAPVIADLARRGNGHATAA